jgi:hypothetical protein
MAIITASSNDIKSLIAYLSSLWGTLSGLSLLFPVSNALLNCIPTVKLETLDNPFVAPKLLTALATVASLFVIMIVVSKRRSVRLDAVHRDFEFDTMRQAAIRDFVLATMSLFLYLACYFVLVTKLSDEQMRQLPNWVPFAPFFLFPATFALLSAAFTRLGLREYLAEKADASERA